MSAGLRLEVVDSTLDELHRRAAEGAPDGTWLVAVEQRAGRGSRGRTWHSAPGGLWLSVLRRGPSTAGGFELLSLRAGMAVARVLDGLPAIAPVMLKWPNDLIVADRKVGGVLAEARWAGERLQWVAIGVGINVRNTVPPELADRAAALGEFCEETSPEALADPVAGALAAVDLATPELSAGELAAYRERDWLLGRAVTAPRSGTGGGIGADGRLAIRDEAGVVHRITLGEVVAA
ncbi:MAG TPA: biotin--[acetyl-CoA-carboxylase] ligase [Gemmatimonadales bacterium]|nr:biotin--[acetyl-CoA-carboxylase] ligase [Gemmatimonadales bacterium]